MTTILQLVQLNRNRKSLPQLPQKSSDQLDFSVFNGTMKTWNELIIVIGSRPSEKLDRYTGRHFFPATMTLLLRSKIRVNGKFRINIMRGTRRDTARRGFPGEQSVVEAAHGETTSAPIDYKALPCQLINNKCKLLFLLRHQTFKALATVEICNSQIGKQWKKIRKQQWANSGWLLVKCTAKLNSTQNFTKIILKTEIMLCK